MTVQQVDTSPSALDALLETGHDDWFSHWLQWMIPQVPGVESAIVVHDVSGKGGYAPVAMLPLESRWEKSLLDICEKTLQQSRPLIKSLESEHYYAGSWPVRVADELKAVVAVVLKAPDEQKLHDALAQLEWLSGWIELKVARDRLDTQAEELGRQQRVLEGFAGVLESDSFEHAALYYVNMLATRLRCDRVVLGFCKGGELAIHSQSSSSTYSERHALMRHTAAAMQEAVDQRESVIWPPSAADDVQVTVAHRELNDALGSRAFLSVPLVDRSECYGAVLFERHQETAFSESDLALAEALANLVGSALLEKREAELPLWRYTRKSIEAQLEKLMGPGFLWRKIAVATTVLVFLFFTVARGDYRLAADAVLEGGELRAMAAPFDSYIESASFRAGDRVSEGAILATLDTRELRLQRMSWMSQMAQAQRQYEEALAKQERAKVQVNSAQVSRARAELELVEYQISQAQLVAPFDALVVSGDLSQRIGTAVRQGDTLYELAPSDDFRLALYVDEFRVGDVYPGLTGEVVLSALSEQAFPFRVDRIIPMAEVREGETVYKVEASLTGVDEELRAGLEGVGQIDVGRRHLIDIWTRRLREKVSLEWWRFWG